MAKRIFGVCSIRRTVIVLGFFSINIALIISVMHHRKHFVSISRKLLYNEQGVTAPFTAAATRSEALNSTHTNRVFVSSSYTSPTPIVLPRCSLAKNFGGRLIMDFALAEKTYRVLSVGETTLLKKAEYHANELLGDYKEVALKTSSTELTMFEPTDCQSTYSVAFIIPFRYREEHLRLLLGHLIPVLKRQLNRFGIFVITQMGNDTFNKGRLMNTGFQFAMEAGKAQGKPFDCFVFHDVDLLVEHDNLIFRCPGGRFVQHFSTSINKFHYNRLCCGMTVGGVLGFTEEQFTKVNGYSNEYWGWGAEDDDMNTRIKTHKLVPSRASATAGRYTMLVHEHDAGNPIDELANSLLEKAISRLQSDGLINLNTTVTSVQQFPLFNNVIVDVGSNK